MNHVNAFAYPTAYAAGLSNSFHPSIVMPLSATNELRASRQSLKIHRTARFQNRSTTGSFPSLLRFL